MSLNQTVHLNKLKGQLATVTTHINELNEQLDVDKKPDSITDQDWILMTRQQYHMRMYKQILDDRIAVANGEPIAAAKTRMIHLQSGSEDQSNA